MKALGDAATDLTWLVPGASSLLALGRDDSPWPLVRSDPAAVLVLLRSSACMERFEPERIGLSHVETCLTLLDHGCRSFVDWHQPGPDVVYRQCLAIAGRAQALAERCTDCPPEQAWTVGLLAPLGWLAFSAIAADHLPKLLKDDHDHTPLVRRLCRNWRLPAWYSNVVCNLALPAEVAKKLGADATLFQVVQLAILLSQQQPTTPTLRVGATLPGLLANLKLEPQVAADIAAEPVETLAIAWTSPAQVPLLEETLKAALENRRRLELAQGHELATQLDGVQTALVDQCTSEKERLFQRNMLALAEMAGGAGHEINNPLAVISGQAQYLLRQLEQAECLAVEEPSLAPIVEELQEKFAQSLKTIVGQSQRIHRVLTDLMQFAKPSTPKVQAVPLNDLLEDVGGDVEDLAQVHKVRLIRVPVPETWRGHFDPQQTRTALGCLLRNAVEAAPTEGWASLRVEKKDEQTLVFLIEDNGPGPSLPTADHLFHPFFSGRSAGRGRGLGLSTAWRLLQQQNGDVRFDGHTQGVTRFLVTLPACADASAAAGFSRSNGHGQHLVALG